MKKKVISVILIGVILMGVYSCASSDSDTPKKVDNTETTSSDKPESNAPEIFNIGDTVELKDFKVTVNSIRTETQDKTGLVTAEEGKEYFLVNCTIENISNEEQTVSSVIMFDVVDQDGLSYDQSIFPDAVGKLDGSLAPTRKMTGEYCVEVPQGKTGLELVFDGSFITSGQVIVKLN